jgi:hypothetical protein
VNSATSQETISNVVGRLGAEAERQWKVRIGRVPSTDAHNDTTPRYYTLIDALFYVDFAINDLLGAVDVRVIAWDRDLTGDLRGPSRAPFVEVEELFPRVQELIARVTPAPYVSALRDWRQGHARLPSAPVTLIGVDATLELRALREHGEDPIAHVDLTRLEQLADLQWPRGVATRTSKSVVIRPYDTNRVSFQLDQHGSVEAGVILHSPFVAGTLLGRPLYIDNDERSVVLTMAAIDDWLHLSRPGVEILAQQRLSE